MHRFVGALAHSILAVALFCAAATAKDASYIDITYLHDAQTVTIRVSGEQGGYALDDVAPDW